MLCRCYPIRRDADHVHIGVNVDASSVRVDYVQGHRLSAWRLRGRFGPCRVDGGLGLGRRTLVSSHGVGYLWGWGGDNRRGTRGAQQVGTFPNGIKASLEAEARHQGPGRRLWGPVRTRAQSASGFSATDLRRSLHDIPRASCEKHAESSSRAVGGRVRRGGYDGSACSSAITTFQTACGTTPLP